MKNFTYSIFCYIVGNK